MIRILKIYSKQFEAVGLMIVLGAAYFQILSDSYRNKILHYRLSVIEDELQYTRQKNSELFECTIKNDCTDYHYDLVKPEAGVFDGIIFENREPTWRIVRLILFFFGTAIIVGAKLADWPKRNSLVTKDERSTDES